MKKTTLLLLSALVGLRVSAQKLPNVQQVSVKAPADVKVDGKQTEWGNKFQAYNSTTELWYTMANDDKNLYLTIQANDPVMFGLVSRIVANGITLNIVNSSVKDNKGISITYPVKNDPAERHYVFMDNNNRGKQIVASDSLQRANNANLDKTFKFITVSGVKDVDTIPVFNDMGIVANHKFDGKNNYNWELSVPLALIKQQINTANTFTYKITINGSKTGSGISMTLKRKGIDPVADQKLQDNMDLILTNANARYRATTYFWGEYTLAK